MRLTLGVSQREGGGDPWYYFAIIVASLFGVLKDARGTRRHTNKSKHNYVKFAITNHKLN